MDRALDRGQETLKVSEAVDLLDFLMLTANANSNARPKSRQYLDWLAGVAGMADVAGESARLARLIIP